MNKVILMGRLTRDPDMRYTQGENAMAIARYTLAVDRRRSGADGQRDADFISCTAFGRQAEFAKKYLHQGSKIAITGRIQTGSYSKNDGQKVYTTDVIVEDQEFAESKAVSDGRRSVQSQGAAGYGHAPAAAYGSRPAAPASTAYATTEPTAAYTEPAPEPEAPVPDYSEAEGEGFMNIPEGVEDEGLPFNFN